MALVGLEIAKRGLYADGQTFGEGGVYERIDGIARFAVDPTHPANEPIVDLDKAARDASGQVHFLADFCILQPTDPAKANHGLLFDILNRGKKVVPGHFNMAPPAPVAVEAIDPGDGFLMRHGWTVGWCGWQWDVYRSDALLGIEAPQALGPDGKPIIGTVAVELQNNVRTADHLLADRIHQPFTAADLNEPGAVMTVREWQGGERTTIPRQRLSWNWVAELPFGRGKAFGRNMNRWLDAVAGGWQISGVGTWSTTWFNLPADQFPTGAPFENYGTKYPIQDCRSGRCLPGYLWFNGYINPAQINTPNGIQGVPANYKPAFQPLIPFPTTAVANDPLAPFYGTNTVFVPLKDGTVFRGAYGGLLPLQNQYAESPGLWTLGSSLFKTFVIHEDVRARVQWDVFNPTNSPQRLQVPNSTGLLYTFQSGTAARSMQFSLRLLW